MLLSVAEWDIVDVFYNGESASKKEKCLEVIDQGCFFDDSDCCVAWLVK